MAGAAVFAAALVLQLDDAALLLAVMLAARGARLLDANGSTLVLTAARTAPSYKDRE